MYIKRRSKRRIKLLGLAFALLIFAIAQTIVLPCSANIIDRAKNKSEEIGTNVSDMARDAENKVDEIVTDVESKADEIMTDAESKLNDASDGKVEDSDGLIGNESENTPEKINGMGKVGQVSLIVLAVAAVIAVIIIITLASRKKNK